MDSNSSTDSDEDYDASHDDSSSNSDVSDQDELPELVPQRVAKDVVDVDQNPVVAETESQHN